MMQIVSSDAAGYTDTVKGREKKDENFESLLARRKHERDAFFDKIRQRKESFALRFSGFLASVVKPYMEEFRLRHTGLLVESVPVGLDNDTMTLAYAVGEKNSGLSFVIEIQCNAGSEEILCGSSFFNMQETTFYTGFDIKSLELSNSTIYQIELILFDNIERMKKKMRVEKFSEGY